MFKREDCHGIRQQDTEEIRERRLSMIERAQEIAKKESDKNGNPFDLETK